MRNLRYANEAGGILVEQDNGIDLYAIAGSLYDEMVAGKHGAIAAYVAPVKTAEELAAEDLATEQEWVVDELAQADKEIFILEDGDPRGKADVPSWRTYRKDLRNHTTGERPTRPL